MLLALLPTVLAAVNGKATASSVLVDPEDKKIKHSADLAVDGLFGRGWGEGAPGYGENSWLELDLGRVTEIREVNIWGGNLSEGKKSFREYSRPKKIKITLSGGGGAPVEKEVVLQDMLRREDIKLDAPVKARTVRIDVIETYDGFVFSDMFIAEVAVNFTNCREEIQPIIDWLDTPAAQKLAEKHDQAIIDAYTKITSAEFGDQETLEWVMDQAGDGAEFIRDQVPRLVDVGFRAAAIRPDEQAIDCLRKLKDANGIPAIEMALLRSYGRRAAELQDIVEIFYAYQTLIGGPGLNIPYWGETGFGLGQIQSFGEPIPIEVDPDGNLYIADIGNNRIQRFTYEGRADRQWGGAEADIANDWFDEGRTWYVSGAAPGKDNGKFVNPLDIELIPMGEEGETGFAVIDASKRVQIFDQEGRPLIGWPIENNAQLDPGIGGEAYIVWLPKKKELRVVLGDEMIGYTLQAEETLRVELEDGTPNGLEVGKDGKLYFVYGREVVTYNADGFREGVIWDTEQLGEGFESMDITIDENGKLWVVTDRGWVYKFKNKRKIEYSVQFVDFSLENPRIAVQEERLYCVDRDKIITFDALQAKIDADEAALEAAEEAAREEAAK